MPPYSSYLLQPLDIACFSPLKRVYSGLVKERMCCGSYYINKLEFLNTYYTIYYKVFKPGNI